MEKRYEDMGVEELRKELGLQREYLEDFEETHSFNIGKTSAHIGASLFATIQGEFEEERMIYIERINTLEALIKDKTT